MNTYSAYPSGCCRKRLPANTLERTILDYSNIGSTNNPAGLEYTTCNTGYKPRLVIILMILGMLSTSEHGRSFSSRVNVEHNWKDRIIKNKNAFKAILDSMKYTSITRSLVMGAMLLLFVDLLTYYQGKQHKTLVVM